MAYEPSGQPIRKRARTDTDTSTPAPRSSNDAGRMSSGTPVSRHTALKFMPHPVDDDAAISVHSSVYGSGSSRPQSSSQDRAIEGQVVLADAPHIAPRRFPRNNRERLYGLLPLPSDKNYEAEFEKRNNAARVRRLHSASNQAAGEAQRPIPCARCARHLAEWEGPDEGPRPICVDPASGSVRCTRCSSAECQKRCVQVSGALGAKVKALEETAQRALTDSDLPALHAAQLAVKKAMQQVITASKRPAADQAKVSKEAQEYNEERRLLAVELQAKATMELARSNMEIARAVVRHGDILERSLALLQPMTGGGLTPDAFDGEDMNHAYDS